jgi:hypothetical protein
MTETREELAGRTMDARGFIRHGLSSIAPGTRVMRNDNEVGVVAVLTGSETLNLDVVWLTGGRESARAAKRALEAYRAGHRVAELVPAAGLIAVDGHTSPNADRCVLSDPYHVGLCMALPAGI